MLRNKTVYEKVIYQQDYLQCICIFLSMQDVVSIFYRLSHFHNNFLKDKRQLNMYYSLLSYDFGNICQIYNIKYDHQDNKDDNICHFFSKFYWDKKYLRHLSASHGYGSDILKFVMTLQHMKCLERWFWKVRKHSTQLVVCCM